jgi:DNA modification methylase
MTTKPHRIVLACGVTLYLGDCMKIAPTLDGVDAIITDPPYGMDWDTDSTRFSGGQRKRGDGRKDWGSIHGDAEPFEPERWLQYPKCVMWGSNHYAKKLPLGTTLVWIKKDEHLWGSFLSDAELAWMKGGHGVYTKRIPWSPPTRAIDYGGDVTRPKGIHPTQKPVALMAWCMDKAKVPEGATVLDPYMGSGSTIIAAIRTERKAIGIEKDPQHFRTALDRIQRELNQGDVFRNQNAGVERLPTREGNSK